MSKSTKSRPRQQLSRAELKAYEARRAAEVHRVGVQSRAAVNPNSAESAQVRRSYVLNRTEEFSIIRADMRRLLMIMAILIVVLAVATFVLR